MARLTLLAAIAAVALAAPSNLAAKPRRAVVLLDFTRGPAPAPPVTSQTQTSPINTNALSAMMVRQFTGGFDAPQTLEQPARSAALQMIFSPAALGNPFLRHSVMAMPAAPLVLPGSSDECGSANYQPSVGFGRSAEERRRTLFPLVQRAACEAGLPVGLFDALVMQESRYRPAIVSPKGAFGLAQLMPGTADSLGVNRYSLLDNLRGGARYLKDHIDTFGRYDLALAAYNAGPNRRSLREGRIPAIAETQGYVRSILANWSGTPLVPATPARQLSLRQAQTIFMAYRGSDN